MTEQRQKLKQILTELEYSHDYLFTDDDIPTILDKIEAVICNTRCCATLKTKKAPTFEHWLICNFEETKTGKYIDFNNGDTYNDKQVLKLKYNKIFKPTL